LDIRTITIVCFANYCRSPVAEKLLRAKLPVANFSITSAGIIDFQKNEMDRRSRDFLFKMQIENLSHSCKVLTDVQVKQSDLILAIDITVLEILLKKYPNKKEKFKLFSRFNPSEIIRDPYKFTSDEDYVFEMEKIVACTDRWSEKLQDLN